MSEQTASGTVTIPEVVSRAVKPSRGNVLVRAVKTEETMPGGAILIPEASRERLASHQMEILAVGEPQICEDEECERYHIPLHVATDGEADYMHPCHTPRENWPKGTAVHPIDHRLVPGAWVYVAPRSLVDAGDATDRRYFVRVEDVVGVFIQED